MTLERFCPKCGDTENMQFRIDDTAVCYVCNWEGHEDEVLEAEAVRCKRCTDKVLEGHTDKDGLCEDCQGQRDGVIFKLVDAPEPEPNGDNTKRVRHFHTRAKCAGAIVEEIQSHLRRTADRHEVSGKELEEMADIMNALAEAEVRFGKL